MRDLSRREVIFGTATVVASAAEAHAMPPSRRVALLGTARYWTPTQLAAGTNAAWLNAAVLSSIGVVSGQVAQWSDISGNGNHVVQANAAKQPIYNGAGILCSGLGDFLQTVGNFPVLGATQRTIFAVAKNFTSFPTVGFWGAQSAGQGFGLDFKLATAGTGYVWGQNDLNFGTAFTGSRGLLVFGNDGSTSYAGANGQLALSTVADVINTAAGPLSIGARPTGVTNFAEIEIDEYLVVTGAMPTALRQILEGYTAWEWGFVALLPAGHPYKNRRPT